MVRIHDQQFAMLFRQEASLIEVNQRGIIIFKALQNIDSLKFIVQAFGSSMAVSLFEPLFEVVRWTYVFSRSTDLVNI